MTQIGMGAEAILERTPEGILKTRPPKPYRHTILDTELRTSRTRHEAKILQKAKAAGVRVPEVTIINDTTLLLTDIAGVQLKEVLDENPLLAHEVGRMIAKLHDANIIHGDLTTSNIMAGTHLTIIDFGLSYISPRDEDKAVDIHLLHQSLESKHHRVLTLAYRHFLKGYRMSHNAEKIIAQLRKVEARGRNKANA